MTKNINTVVTTGFHASRGTLCGFFLPEKNQLPKRFRNLSGSSLCFVEKFRQIREKCITASRWICWRKTCSIGRNTGLQLFSGRWEEKCRTLAKKINNIVRFALLSVWIIFSKRKNFLEKNKHFANFLKFSTDFFVNWGTSTYYWQKIFSMLEKFGFHASAGFCHRKLSFLVNDCLQNFFQSLGGCFLDFGKKTSTDCQNCFIICPEKHLLRKVRFSNKKFFTGFFQNVERCRTLAMNLLPIVKNAFHLSRGTFREKCVFGKNIKCSITFFRIRETLFSSGLRKNRAFGRKVSAGLPKLDSTLPKCMTKENSLFWMKNCLETFYQTFG